MADGGSEDPGADEGERPAYLPEKFWDPGSKTAKVEELATSFTTLETSFTRKQDDIRADIDKERFANRPETAEKYEYKIPSSIEAPPGFNLTAMPDHPMLPFWREKAFDLGLDQAGFEEGIAHFVKTENARLPVMADQIKNFGENGQDRFTRATDWVKGIVTEDEFKQLGNLVTTSAGITVLEKLMDKVGVPLHSGDGHGTTEPEDDPANLEAFEAKTKRMMEETGSGTYAAGDAGAVAAVRARWAKSSPGTVEPQRNRS